MKVLFTGLLPIWQCHFIAECNFIEEHLAAGDEVAVLTCDASLKACDANPGHSLPHCLVCMGMRQSAVELLSSPIRSLPLISPGAAARLRSFPQPEFRALAELKRFAWEGLDVGQDVYASLITATGSAFFCPLKHAGLVRKTIRDFVAVYLTAMEYLEKDGYDLIYVFNGRFASAKAWIRACEKTRTDYMTHERLGMPDRALRIKNGSPHGTLLWPPLIREFWDKNRDNPEVLKEAHDFFEERPQGRLTGWFSFVNTQDRKSLPETWDAGKRNMVIFSSSVSEFAGLPDYFEGAAFHDQRQAYLDLASSLQKNHGDIRLFLRVHPNSRLDTFRWWEDPEFSSLENLTVIPPESAISSYELLQQCEKVIVFITTMGIEATFWGKPSIVLSNAMYSGIGAAYEPRSLEEACEMLAADLPPKPREAALAYGGFMRCGSAKLPLSDSLDHCKLTFKGHRPNANAEILRSLWNWENIVSKARVPSSAKALWQKWEWFRLRRTLKSRSCRTQHLSSHES